MSSTLIKNVQTILWELASGPKHNVELKRALCWDVVTDSKALGLLMQKLKVAGLVVHGDDKKWRLAKNLELCSHCRGRGVKGV